MSKQSIDFVLLPPEEISDKVIELNKKLKRNYSNPRIILNKEACLPHISLLIGTISPENLMQIQETLNRVALQFSPIELILKSLDLEDLPAKDRTLKIAGFSLAKSNSLQKLHETLLYEMKKYSLEDTTKDTMYNSQEIDEKDTPWMFSYINNFSKNSSLEKFNPHITIGDGEMYSQDYPDYLPLTFKASRLALCHLGNYCTCRKILAENKLMS